MFGIVFPLVDDDPREPLSKSDLSNIVLGSWQRVWKNEKIVPTDVEDAILKGELQNKLREWVSTIE